MDLSRHKIYIISLFGMIMMWVAVTGIIDNILDKIEKTRHTSIYIVLFLIGLGIVSVFTSLDKLC